MKKLLLLFLVWVYPVVGFSVIDECKTDIYYANGILAEEEDVRLNTLDLLSPIIESNIYGAEEEMKKHIGEVGYSYNQTSGNMPQDGWETYMQKFGLQGFIDWWLALKGYITTHLEDVEEHIKKYSNRIKLGHKVLVVAHSQGNLFTNEIYKALGKRSENAWMQDYFGAVSVASPMKADIKDDTERITWDNDGVGRLIAHNGSVDPNEVPNPIRSVEWEHSFDYNSFDATAEVIPAPYARQTQIGKVIGVGSQKFGYLGYKAIEDDLDLAFNVHAFTYYMGEPLSRDVEIDIPLVPFADGTIVKKEFKDPFDENKTLQTNLAKDLIVSAIKDQLDLLDKVDSQWIKDQEFEKDTCDYRITVKHRFDLALEIGEKVYPFAPNQKLYTATNQKSGEVEYVKATCGGTDFMDDWDGKKENECWMIDNPQEEKIESESTIKFYAYYLFYVNYSNPIWPYLYANIMADSYSTEISSLVQWREIRPSQRECKTQLGFGGLSPNTDYFYLNPEPYIENVEEAYIFRQRYYNTVSKYTMACILEKNGKSFDDIKSIERGNVTSEYFTSLTSGYISHNKIFFIEYIMHIK